MVSVECIGKGVAKFADREILKNVDCWKKVVVGAAIALAINRSQDIAASYRENTVVKIVVSDNRAAVSFEAAKSPSERICQVPGAMGQARKKGWSMR